MRMHRYVNYLYRREIDHLWRAAMWSQARLLHIHTYTHTHKAMHNTYLGSINGCWRAVVALRAESRLVHKSMLVTVESWVAQRAIWRTCEPREWTVCSGWIRHPFVLRQRFCYIMLYHMHACIHTHTCAYVHVYTYTQAACAQKKSQCVCVSSYAYIHAWADNTNDGRGGMATSAHVSVCTHTYTHCMSTKTKLAWAWKRYCFRCVCMYIRTT
jgi:hypothetical protein